MTTRRVLVVVLCAAAMLVIAAPALAYDEVASGKTCVDCHGTAAPTVGEPSGPHGGYSATTAKCEACHTVHDAPDAGVKLLEQATVLATCQSCHDGTGGKGVYGAIQQRTGVAPAAAHSMLDLATSIPGGDGTTGGDRTFTFSGASNGLSCNDCHTPHGSNTVAAFTGDRGRSGDDGDPANTVVSSRLLKQRPTSMDSGAASVTVYGSDWCGACHAGRLSGTTLHNHPVESSINLPTPIGEPMFYYDLVARAGQATVEGTLGHNNFGYVMADKPRIPEQTGHDPICQQCHEDPRSVGDVTMRTIDATEVFAIDDVDGLPSDPAPNDDSPRFQTFPHESTVPSMLIEQDDDLCLNCHAPAS